MLSPAQSRRNAGFTFLEIMLVVLIIGIMVAVVGPNLVGRTTGARIAATKQQMESIETALKMYEAEVGDFPSSEEGLAALLRRPQDVHEDMWNGPYLSDRELPKDAWKRSFEYASPGENDEPFTLASAGKDGRFGTEDDIPLYEESDEADF